MGVPSPAIPSFTDGTVVHQADLNALASNLTNLYAYNQAGFFSQRPAAFIKQTTGQAISNSVDTLVSFQTAVINTDNMWVASQPNQLTIQHAGIYLVSGQCKWFWSGASPSFGTVTVMSLLANGTTTANAIGANMALFDSAGPGIANQAVMMVNLAAGATLYLNAWQSSGVTQTLATDFGGSYISAVFLTSST